MTFQEAMYKINSSSPDKRVQCFFTGNGKRLAIDSSSSLTLDELTSNDFDIVDLPKVDYSPRDFHGKTKIITKSYFNVTGDGNIIRTDKDTNNTNVTDLIIDDGIRGVLTCPIEYPHNIHFLTLPESLEQLNKGVFEYYPLRQIFGLHDTKVKVIPDNCFKAGVESEIKNLNLPYMCREIGDSAFFGNRNLDRVDFPKNIKWICDFAFDGCNSIKTLYFTKDIPKVSKLAFSNESKIDRTLIYEGRLISFLFHNIGKHIMSRTKSRYICCVNIDILSHKKFPDRIDVSKFPYSLIFR